MSTVKMELPWSHGINLKTQIPSSYQQPCFQARRKLERIVESVVKERRMMVKAKGEKEGKKDDNEFRFWVFEHLGNVIGSIMTYNRVGGDRGKQRVSFANIPPVELRHIDQLKIASSCTDLPGWVERENPNCGITYLPIPKPWDNCVARVMKLIERNVEL
ncbi:beta-amyrin 11-oxidase-like [Senna tora]|uniref:Beta-amyrin 11-oxidase-like n=1 Tax=Senna tora TaxID=362788 RepID=A0A834WML8_9FABA|nr:beta-amyrin 11-oxidase-like [Senna tora]